MGEANNPGLTQLTSTGERATPLYCTYLILSLLAAHRDLKLEMSEAALRAAIPSHVPDNSPTTPTVIELRRRASLLAGA